MRWIALGLAILLIACTDRSFTPVTPEALAVGEPVRIFATTSRVRDANGGYGFERAEKLSFLRLTISVPPGHKPGEVRVAYATPDPRREFTLAGRKTYDDASDFVRAIAGNLRERPVDDREIILFVHGYNATQSETAFRAAQLTRDLDLPGVQVIYSWPTRGKALGYAYDHDSMLFARDGLEQTLDMLSRTGARRIILVAHSMGSALTMEALRQAELKTPGWAARRLGAVLLISPDLDIDVFRAQMRALDPPPQPIVIFASKKDKILNLSARIRGSNPDSRLGRISEAQKLADLPVEVVDTTAFSEEAGSGHFIPATSPSLLKILGQARKISTTFAPDDLTLGTVITGGRAQGGTAIRLPVTLQPLETE